MRKLLTILLCFTAIIISGTAIAYADDGDLTVSVKVEDGLEIPESGITVTVYAGVRKSSGGGGTEWGGPYILNDEYNLVSAVNTGTSWLTKKSFNPYGNTTVTLTPSQPTAEAVISVNGGRFNVIAYEINSGGYIGSGGYTVGYGAATGELEVSYVKGVTLSGKVTVPASENDLSYRISAGADITDREDIQYDYTFRLVGENVLYSGETEIEYSMTVRPDLDYDVYVSFDDEYKMMHKRVQIGNEDKTVDFTAESAKKITGTIKLPDSCTDFRDTYENEYDELQATIFLQDANEPYKLIDIDGAILTPDSNSAEFELYNFTDAEDTIVFYSLLYTYHVNGLADGADYYDDTRCVPYTDAAARLDLNDHDIVINMLESSEVYIDLENQSTRYNIYQALVMIADTDGNTVYTTLPAGFRGDSYCFKIPEGYDRYYFTVVPAVSYDEEPPYSYYSENGFKNNIKNADCIMVSDGDQNIVWDGYDPVFPIKYEVSERVNDSGLHIYTVNYDNIGDFDYVANVYQITYYTDGSKEIERNRTRTISSGANVHNELSMSETTYDMIEKIEMLIWDENLRPLCKKITIKQNEE